MSGMRIQKKNSHSIHMLAFGGCQQQWLSLYILFVMVYYMMFIGCICFVDFVSFVYSKDKFLDWLYDAMRELRCTVKLSNESSEYIIFLSYKAT